MQKRNIKDELKKFSYKSKAIGRIKEKYYIYLQKKYKFDKWHITPINFREYAVKVVDFLNINKADTVVEIGCGLGEIICNINAENKYGYDIEKNVLWGAKFVDLEKKTNFIKGSFQDIKGLNIDYLITLNFIYNIPPEELKQNYEYVCQYNNVKNIIMDEVRDKTYKYNHHGDFLLEEFQKKKRIGSFNTQNGKRMVWLYERKD